MPGLVADIAAGRPGERVEVWFEDEARFGQKGSRTRVWADRGTRPTAPERGGFGDLLVPSAVGPATGRAEGLVCPVLNAGVVQTFLDQWAATIPAGTHAVLVWDGAGYHSAAKAVRPPAAGTLVTLPAYAPELNPVERLWPYLREHHWPNRTYRDLAALEEAAVAGWRAVCLDAERVKSICRCEYTVAGS